MADSERGWTFEELDEEERKMAAYEQLLAAKEACLLYTSPSPRD